MDWAEFRARVDADDFFTHLDRADPVRRRACWPWLPLLTTEAISRWARDSGWFAAARKKAPGECVPVLRLLLERHALHLAARRGPAALGDFWRWAAPGHPALAGLWERARLADTLAHDGLRAQEDHFARVLHDCAGEIGRAGGPAWAAEALRRLAARRRLGPGGTVANASVQVVFAWARRSPVLRPGLLVAFQLLAESGYRTRVNRPEVFDAAFLKGLEAVEGRTGAEHLRRLEHPWEGLGDGSLRGPSGTMAVWLAQRLAAGGRPNGGRRWALPPWVVVSATLDRDGDGSGGAAGPAGLLPEKAALLVEEGVRALIVEAGGPPSPGRGPEPAAPRYTNVPGAEDLQVLGVRGGVDALAAEVRRRDYVWPADLPDLTTELLPRLDPLEDYRLPQRTKAEFLLFDLASDYVPPAYALAALGEARRDLPGRGYLHLTAPAGMGKSVLARALREGWDGTPADFGLVLGYTVLHGRPENPSLFLAEVVAQAERAGESRGRQLHGLRRPHERLDFPQARAALVHLLDVARQRLCDGRPLALSVDGLDELADRGGEEEPLILETLPDAEHLPEGCYVLLTSRPDLRPKVREALHRRCGDARYFRAVGLSADDPGYRAVLEEFLTRTLGEAVRPHVAAVVGRAAGRFLRVRFLRDLLRGRSLRRLRGGQLPEGDAVFPAYLRRMATQVEGGRPAFRQWHRPILLLVAAAYEPVTRRHLRLWLGVREEDVEARDRLDQALDELASLLHEEHPPGLPDDSLYALGHQEFLGWLRDACRRGWRGAHLAWGHGRIVRAGRKPPLPPEGLPWHTPDHYHLLHLPSHLLDLGRVDQARAFFAEAGTEALLRSVADELGLKRLPDPHDVGAELINLKRAMAAKGFFAALPHVRLAERYIRQWDWPRALAVLECRVTQLRRLLDAAGGELLGVRDDGALGLLLADSLVRQAEVFHHQAAGAAALPPCEHAVRLLERLVTRKGDYQAAREDPEVVAGLATACTLLGAILLNRGRPCEGAVDAYERAVVLAELLVGQAGGDARALATHPGLVRCLVNALAGFCAAAKVEGVFTAASGSAEERAPEWRRRLRGLLRRLTGPAREADRALPDDPEQFRELARAHAAVSDDRRAVALLERLVEGAGGDAAAAHANPGLVQDLATACLSDWRANRGGATATRAAQARQRAIALMEQVVAATGGVAEAAQWNGGLLRDLGLAYLSVALDLHRSQGGVALPGRQEALGMYGRALDLLERLARAHGPSAAQPPDVGELSDEVHDRDWTISPPYQEVDQRLRALFGTSDYW
jgi:tetratricopeptide (TPR) repeat protein